MTLDGQQREAATHTATDFHRRREAHLVQAVIDTHAAKRQIDLLLEKSRQQRQRQETVRNGPAKRRLLFCPLDIDMDPLRVFGRLREQVDPLLVNRYPRRHRDFLADFRLKLIGVVKLPHP